MKGTDLRQIFTRYLAGKASRKEIRFLFREFTRKNHETELRSLIRERMESGEGLPDAASPDTKPVLEDIWKTIKAKISYEVERKGEKQILPVIHRLRWLKYSAAAVIAILIAASFFFFLNYKQPREKQQLIVRQNDVAPGSNKAILTLANGKKIALDSAMKGMISTQGNTKILKTGNGLLTYDKSNLKSPEVLFNTISTPKGGQYQVILSDRTKVWLNAASSIHFPNEFTGKTRKVQVTGEAYFEVTDDPDKPFQVIVNNITVQVLGTHFNVMAYQNEPVAKVTLIQGAVKVKEGNKDVLLQPGEQAQISSEGQITKVKALDDQATIAWINNQFWFEDDDIQTVMRELARWYNVKVVIRGNIPQHFGGIISRSLYVSKVLQALQATSHIKYEIQDSTIIVSP